MHCNGSQPVWSGARPSFRYDSPTAAYERRDKCVRRHVLGKRAAKAVLECIPHTVKVHLGHEIKSSGIHILATCLYRIVICLRCCGSCYYLTCNNQLHARSCESYCEFQDAPPFLPQA